MPARRRQGPLRDVLDFVGAVGTAYEQYRDISQGRIPAQWLAPPCSFCGTQALGQCFRCGAVFCAGEGMVSLAESFEPLLRKVELPEGLLGGVCGKCLRDFVQLDVGVVPHVPPPRDPPPNGQDQKRRRENGHRRRKRRPEPYDGPPVPPKPIQDAFAVLGLQPSRTTIDSLRKRVKELSKLYHPDLNSGQDKRMVEINKAAQLIEAWLTSQEAQERGMNPQ